MSAETLSPAQVAAFRAAAADVQELASMYRGAIDIGEALSAIEDIDAAKLEAEAARDRARVEAEDARQTLGVLLDKVTEAEQRRRQAEANALKLTQRADDAADRAEAARLELRTLNAEIAARRAAAHSAPVQEIKS